MTSADEVIDRVHLEPEPGFVESLGGNHTLETSIADLIDNALDACATRVSVRFLTSHDRLVQVEVLDNGVGMDAATATRAMKLGHRRTYGPADLGHFGLGLKAASFAHADTLTVWSRNFGQPAVGRRIRRVDFSRDFSCDILSEEAANVGGLTREVIMGSPVGTSVIWHDIRHPYQGNSAVEARLWLATRIEALRSHLGVTFHRMIADGRISLDTLVDELDGGLAAPGIPVLAIDPFGYAASGHPEYPKSLTAKLNERVTHIACHIWPAKSDTTAFRLGGKSGEPFQGFYVYRHDRLLQVGSWLEVATGGPNRQLARVVLDDSEAIAAVMSMNAEKSRLRFKPAFHSSISEAEASDGTTFEDFLQDAESIYTDAGKRRRQRQPAIRPERGFAPSVRKRVASELPLTDGEPLSIRWERRIDDDFFQVDLAAKTLRLNSRYRHLFAPDGGTLNDAPMLKSLMYLLMHHVFEGQFLGARDKDEIALWQSVLTSAASTEEHLHRKNRER